MRTTARFLCFPVFATAILFTQHLHAQRTRSSAETAEFEFASMREDVRMLTQRVGELTLRMEQLERENNELRSKSASSAQAYATVTQLNQEVANMNRMLKAGMDDQEREILVKVSGQMERLAKQTQAAIDALAKNQATRPPVNPIFTEDFAKEGVSYTVQKGDSLASIAKKTGGTQKDIINANKITDPSKIQVGQTLFIPQAKTN